MDAAAVVKAAEKLTGKSFGIDDAALEAAKVSIC